MQLDVPSESWIALQREVFPDADPPVTPIRNGFDILLAILDILLKYTYESYVYNKPGRSNV